MGGIVFSNKKLLFLKDVAMFMNFYAVELDLNSFVFYMAYFIYVSPFLSY